MARLRLQDNHATTHTQPRASTKEQKAQAMGAYVCADTSYTNNHTNTHWRGDRVLAKAPHFKPQVLHGEVRTASTGGEATREGYVEEGYMGGEGVEY